MTKKILYQEKARQALEKGMAIMAEAVSVTLGPKGRNVVLDKKYGSPQIINDGVTIAKEVELKNHIENTGVSLLRQAAAKTNDVAGDGTTTATVLAYAIVKEGMKNVASGANPISLKIGIERATNYMTNLILEYSRPIENNEAIAQVASISAGNDMVVGKMIADILKMIGRNGIITLEEGKSTETELEITEGMRFEKGFISPYFVTNPERMEVEYENAYVLVTDKKISLVQQDLIPILEKVAPTKRPLLIIAEDIEKEVLATLVLNKLRGIVNVVAVRAPGFGDFRKSLLEDISILCGSLVISDDLGLKLEKVDLSMLGRARKVVVKRDSTMLVCEGDLISYEITKRCEQLQKQVSNCDSLYEREKLQDRIAKLSGGIAVLKVGAVTDTEMKDKKLRLEDAINATKAGVEEGIVPGGGTLFVHLAKSLKSWAKINLKDDELVGAFIIARAILEPLKRIGENAGKNGTVIIEALQERDYYYGYNASLNEFGDMFDFGIVDPAKVTRSALQNASSIASMILTTECIIVENDKN